MKKVNAALKFRCSRVVYKVAVTPETHKNVAQLAKKRDRSMSDVVKRILAEQLHATAQDEEIMKAIAQKMVETNDGFSRVIRDAVREHFSRPEVKPKQEGGKAK